MTGIPLIIERLGIFELIAAWWWTRGLRRGPVYAMEPVRLISALPVLPRVAQVRWLEVAFPHALPEGLRLAFAMCERFGADFVRRDIRYKVLSWNTRLSLDLTLAIKKTLIQRHWQARGHLAALIQAVAHDNQSEAVRVWTEIPAPYGEFLDKAIGRRVRVNDGLGGAVHAACAAFRRTGENVRLLLRLPAKALRDLNRHGVRWSWKTPPTPSARVVAYVHTLSHGMWYYKKILEHACPSNDILYLLDSYYVEARTDNRSALGVRTIVPREMPAGLQLCIREVIGPLLRWLALAPFVGFGSRPVTEAVYWLTSINWRQRMLVEPLRCALFFSNDAYNPDQVVRTQHLRKNQITSINYLHGDTSSNNRWTFNDAYHDFDFFCVNGPFVQARFESMGSGVKNYQLCGSVYLDRLFEYASGRRPVSEELVALKQRYTLILAAASDVDGVQVTASMAGAYYQALERYLRHNSRAFVLVKVHPADILHGVCPWEPAADVVSRMRLIRDEFVTYELVTASDLVVVMVSSVGIESVAAGRPVLYLNFSGNPEIIYYKRYAPHMVIENERDVVPRLDDVLVGGERVISPKTQREIVSNHFVAFDGLAWRRVGECVAGCLEGRS